MASSHRIIYSRIIFSTGIVLLTSLSVLFLYETREESSSSDIVYNTTLTRQALDRVFFKIHDRESASREYFLTLDSSYLKNSTFAMSNDEELALIDSLKTNTPQQQSNFAKLKQYCQESIVHQDSLTRRATRRSNIISNLSGEVKKAAPRMDSIQVLVTRMRDIEKALADARGLDEKKHTVLATMVGVSVSMFSIIVFVIAFYFVDQELKRSQQYAEEKEQLNIKIAEINKELEDANRSLVQLNTELEEKNFQLEKYASELSSFTHITSHDMQEPLRKIQFFISLIEDREFERLSDYGKKYMEKIKLSVSRMRQLFISLLDFSLTNARNKNVEEVDLNEVLALCRLSLNQDAVDSRAVIQNNGLPVVKGIKYQLTQLFENIISNALKFRKDGVSPIVSIECETIYADPPQEQGLLKGRKYHRINFHDNGIGFDPQHAERIFGLFQRLNADSRGVGIGLAISRKIAENHGGILIARSQPSTGSTFVFYIPA